MANYCVNREAQSDSGDHEVHDLDSAENCLPDTSNRIDLGWFATCSDAVAAAKAYFSDVNGCYYCANACHTT